ncbi:MAG: hypothetical protein OIF34_06690, partial [Porticoccaceae bacterium]|nr:hypothetical protein [Porticoccaceae bacterium]
AMTVWRIKACVFFTLLFSTTAIAHKFHHGLAEVDVNSATKTLEVALRLIPEDLENALQNELGRPFNLDHSEDADRYLVAYLARHFRILGPDGHSLPQRWVGKEVNHKAAWLYMELPYTQSGDYQIANTLLVDSSHGEQVNQLLFRQGKDKRSLMFAAPDYQRTITIR